METREAIRAALERLTLRGNKDAFVIIEDKGTGRFVQYAGGLTQGLLFDLPVQGLTPQELSRAACVLGRYGVYLEQHPMYDRPGGRKVGTSLALNRDLGRDIEAATEIAYAALTEIYMVREPIDLSIEEN